MQPLWRIDLKWLNHRNSFTTGFRNSTLGIYKENENTCSGKDLYLGVLTGEGQQSGGGQGILFLFHCSDETLTESSLGEESIYLAYCSRPRSITKESQGRNSSRNLKQKAWRDTAWRLPHGVMLSQLS